MWGSLCARERTHPGELGNRDGRSPDGELRRRGSDKRQRLVDLESQQQSRQWALCKTQVKYKLCSQLVCAEMNSKLPRPQILSLCLGKWKRESIVTKFYLKKKEGRFFGGGRCGQVSVYKSEDLSSDSHHSHKCQTGMAANLSSQHLRHGDTGSPQQASCLRLVRTGKLQELK